MLTPHAQYNLYFVKRKVYDSNGTIYNVVMHFTVFTLWLFQSAMLLYFLLVSLFMCAWRGTYSRGVVPASRLGTVNRHCVSVCARVCVVCDREAMTHSVIGIGGAVAYLSFLIVRSRMRQRRKRGSTRGGVSDNARELITDPLAYVNPYFLAALKLTTNKV